MGSEKVLDSATVKDSKPVPVLVQNVQPLSKRQEKIVNCLASGMLAKEIADKIGVKPTTIKTQLKIIRWKLGAKNSAQAAAIFTRLYPH